MTPDLPWSDMDLLSSSYRGCVWRGRWRQENMPRKRVCIGLLAHCDAVRKLCARTVNHMEIGF